MRSLIKILGTFAICVVMGQGMAATADAATVYTDDKPAVMVESSHPTFSIKLKSNATTGYAWYLRDYNSNLIVPVKQVYTPPEDTKIAGAAGFEIWTFRVKPEGFLVPQQAMIHLVYARSWEVEIQPTDIVFQVTMKSKS